MKQHWPVRETWRASFILCALVAATPQARADAGAIVAEARTQDPARLDGWRATLASGAASERAAAAFAVGQLGMAWEPLPEEPRARAEAALVAALAKEQDAAVRDRIVEALGKVGGPAAVTALVAALDGKQRARAALALAALAKNRALTDGAARVRLEALLGDGAAETRWAAALALSRYRDVASRAALRGCTKDAAVHVRATCAKALADVGGDDDAGALAPLLDDADARVAAEAARTLVKLAAKCVD
ncbi:MAG TPA: HEAT repeat domain-containing protein, partial [Polyangia bacterium]